MINFIGSRIELTSRTITLSMSDNTTKCENRFYAGTIHEIIIDSNGWSLKLGEVQDLGPGEPLRDYTGKVAIFKAVDIIDLKVVEVAPSLYYPTPQPSLASYQQETSQQTINSPPTSSMPEAMDLSEPDLPEGQRLNYLQTNPISQYFQSKMDYSQRPLSPANYPFSPAMSYSNQYSSPSASFSEGETFKPNLKDNAAFSFCPTGQPSLELMPKVIETLAKSVSEMSNRNKPAASKGKKQSRTSRGKRAKRAKKSPSKQGTGVNSSVSYGEITILKNQTLVSTKKALDKKVDRNDIPSEPKQGATSSKTKSRDSRGQHNEPKKIDTETVGKNQTMTNSPKSNNGQPKANTRSSRRRRSRK